MQNYMWSIWDPIFVLYPNYSKTDEHLFTLY